MDRDEAAFEIHVHGEVILRPEVDSKALQDALEPIWRYAGASSLEGGAQSIYDTEPGIRFDRPDHALRMCWSVYGNDNFRQCVDDLCMNLNELAVAGAAVEVTFYDAQFDEEDAEAGRESRDDFLLLFVGPTPQAIMQAQRDLLVEDTVALMERHFDGAQLGGVVAEIDKLFANRLNALVDSLQIGQSLRGGRGGNHRPRRLH